VLPLIVACEIAFWILLLLGLTARYVLRARKMSTVLLICVPLVDVLLLAASALDLRAGAEATGAHGIAAIYLRVSLAFGGQMDRWADQRFAHRFAGGPSPTRPPKAGREHAAHERRQWLRHLLAYAIGVLTMGFFTLLVGDVPRITPAWTPMAGWGIVLVVDFLISFSYTLAPRKTNP
jgi:hypothetical protein